jgi:hypothetical protein
MQNREAKFDAVASVIASHVHAATVVVSLCLCDRMVQSRLKSSYLDVRFLHTKPTSWPELE